MKYYTLILLTLSWNVFSEQCHDTDAFTQINDETIEELGDNSHDEYEFWHKKYHQFLLEQVEPMIQLDGVEGLIGNDIDPELIKKRNSTFIAIISQKQHDDPLKDRLLGLCHYDDLESLCEQHSRFDSESITNDQNVINFFRPLSIAQKNNDEPQIDRLMNAMTDARYANIHFDKHFLLAMRYVEEFIKSIPTTAARESLVLGYSDDLSYLENAHSQYLSDQTLEEYIDTMATLHLAYITSLISSAPAYSPLSRICDNKKFNSSCVEIGKIMTKGNSLITQQVGYSLLKKAALQNLDNTEASRIIFSKAKLWRYTTCLGDFPEPFVSEYPHPAYFPAMVQSYQQGGSELEAVKQASYAVYHAISDAGISTTYDPYACEDIINMDDDAYLKKYSAEDPHLNDLKDLL
ncbi:hypothetical protein [Marinicella sp. W31]|uniref:hypothetical protein n=1 Tax=Marinicella sp. W31 TaxID=3023713 RepID=UPI003756738B